jgi:hypothetical protein
VVRASAAADVHNRFTRCGVQVVQDPVEEIVSSFTVVLVAWMRMSSFSGVAYWSRRYSGDAARSTTKYNERGRKSGHYSIRVTCPDRQRATAAVAYLVDTSAPTCSPRGGADSSPPLSAIAQLLNAILAVLNLNL